MPVAKATPSRSSLPLQDELPLQYVKGVGPARAQILARMGLTTPADVLTYYPRDWEDRRIRFSIKDVPMGEKTTLRGKVEEVTFRTLRSNLAMASATVRDASGSIQAVWFKRTNPQYDVFAPLKKKLVQGQWLMVYGVLEWGPSGKQLRVEDMALLASADAPLSEEDALHFNRLVPVYPMPEGLPTRLIRTIVAKVLPTHVESLPSIVPQDLLRKNDWEGKVWAVRTIHFPEALLEKERARQYLAYEEFFILETALTLLRRTLKRIPKSHPYELKRHLLTPFREHLGFMFTPAQKHVIREIFDDLMSPYPMNRLLQGDVGSGKTLVALSAMLLAVENGGQAALMAPTEILAEQHALTFARYLNDLKVPFVLLTGRQTPTQRKKILEQIEKGTTSIVIGTHALIQKHVRFADLRLIVVDEQHRFGVEHRSLLRQKGPVPDVLVMTATPIPRTLALTLYGDLDVSTIHELPPGRSPIMTRHVPAEVAYAHVLREAAQGRQAYLVYPLVEESDKVELKAAVQEAQLLQSTTFKSQRVGILHGQMKSAEKEAMMTAFRRGDIHILIATSIIEVGIDVANATTIVIHHAERFGLSTLHQLRGRVGRGAHASQCLLIADCKTDDAEKRIEAMINIHDGFRLSEIDLELRGPGEVLGAQQHGTPLFNVGHLLRDAALIQRARHDAEQLLQIDPDLKQPQQATLRNAVQSGYAHRWALGQTG